jgi:hypothetical protein
MPKAKPAAHAAPAAAPASDIPLHTPGDEGAAPPDAGADDQGVAGEDDKDALIAQLQSENASLRGMVQSLEDQLANAEEGAQAAAPPPAPRLIGEDWSHKTSAQAKAAGVTKSVLCSDGYYVPGA